MIIQDEEEQGFLVRHSMGGVTVDGEVVQDEEGWGFLVRHSIGGVTVDGEVDDDEVVCSTTVEDVATQALKG